jgi:hypothetical protein
MNVYRVHQRLISNPIADIRAEVRRQLDRLKPAAPRGPVAITAGSRGVDNLAAILRAAGEWLREKGAAPFIVPCMGSHGGATAEGQRAVLASLGVTAESTGLPIRARMDVVKIGTVGTGDVFMDRYCHAAVGVLVVNRVKLHTAFSGRVQSGLMKMMVVGMGKIRSARTFHNAPHATMEKMLTDMGGRILASGKIWAGLAILEDGFDRTAEIHAVPARDIPAVEPRLLRRHLRYFPRLPLDRLNVLVVDEIGKTYSGTGMDTNVIGYRGIRDFEDLRRPHIRIIAALGLAKASGGNAIGVGLADFITRRLRDALDEEKTLVNVLTTGEMIRAKIPATLADDRAVIETIRRRYGDARWMFIPNTLHLDTLFVSRDLLDEVRASGVCEVDPKPLSVAFRKGRLRLFDRQGGAK